MFLNNARYVGKNIFDASHAMHSLVLALLQVMVAQRIGLIVVYIKTFLDGFHIVITTARCFTAIDEAFDQLLFFNLKTHYKIQLTTTLFQQHV